jgi:hypothetical protein
MKNQPGSTDMRRKRERTGDTDMNASLNGQTPAESAFAGG